MCRLDSGCHFNWIHLILKVSSVFSQIYQNFPFYPMLCIIYSTALLNSPEVLINFPSQHHCGNNVNCNSNQTSNAHVAVWPNPQSHTPKFNAKPSKKKIIIITAKEGTKSGTGVSNNHMGMIVMC